MADKIALDAEQRAVVAADDRWIVLVAGAGSGKTEIVSQRIERLLSSDPHGGRILGVSYTVKAADEMSERLLRRLGPLRARVDTDTVHGYALSVLRTHGTRVGLPVEPEVLTRDEDRAECLRDWLRAEGKHAPDDMYGVLRNIDLARARLEDAPLLSTWREALSDRGALDYPAMLEVAAELTENGAFGRQFGKLYDHVVVDEAQNLTPAQYRFLTGLFGSPQEPLVHAMLIGDDRQSIVDFAGGDGGLIARFERDYRARRFSLTTNYRSAAAIVRIGRQVAAKLGPSPDVEPDVRFPAPGATDVLEFADEAAEAEGLADWVSRLLLDGLPASALAPGESGDIRPADIALLGRSGSYLALAAQAIADRGLEVAQSATEEDWLSSVPAKLVVELLAARAAPHHRSVAKRIAELAGAPKMLMTEQLQWRDVLLAAESADVRELARLDTSSPGALLESCRALNVRDQDWAVDLEQLQLAWKRFVDEVSPAGRGFGNFRQFIARLQRGEKLGPGVRAITVHKAQGREFRAVAIVGCNDGQFPDFRARTDRERASELRAFYVAVTRPTRMLIATRAESRRTRFGPRDTAPSGFLEYLR